MHLADIVTDFKSHFETVKTDAEKYLTEHLPALQGLVDRAETNPLLQAVLTATHLSPETLTALSELVTKLEADLAAHEPPQQPAEATDTAEALPVDGSLPDAAVPAT